ncbi:MAG TPA: SGNH/GDSL hydrolase family protein [Kiritimatiellia bacterium]|nr:SGNH/GDSL hydrolase family protein [Kiritimatiellia bacterium]HPS08099.1 SGNH/GDSL hydrolase family protein [Kiritimatiellia bacterium]
MNKKMIVSCACAALGIAGFALAQEPLTIPVDSPAFVFSPGNWVGDAGRGGKIFRQTWNPGAYFRVTWESDTTNPVPTLLLDVSTYDGSFSPPVLACNLDGIWTADLRCAKEVPLPGMDPQRKTHVLTGYLKTSAQVKRWGTEGASGANVVRIKGLRVAAGSTAGTDAAQPKWALIVGDSITEGVGANELEGYSHLVGQAFRSLGYEYALSACGWSGWLHRGDNPPGDVPGYYVVSNAVDGAGGQYVDALSRWNKIDSLHSLLDANGRISATGGTGQEPAAILVNYATNDAIHPTNASDLRASMAQGLEALREAAPGAHLFFIIPFGQYRLAEIRATVDAYRAAHPNDIKITIVDLGSDAARALTPKGGYWGGLHPNPRGHATFAAQIIAQVVTALKQEGH